MNLAKNSSQLYKKACYRPMSISSTFYLVDNYRKLKISSNKKKKNNDDNNNSL